MEPIEVHVAAGIFRGIIEQAKLITGKYFEVELHCQFIAQPPECFII